MKRSICLMLIGAAWGFFLAEARQYVFPAEPPPVSGCMEVEKDGAYPLKVTILDGGGAHLAVSSTIEAVGASGHQ